MFGNIPLAPSLGGDLCFFDAPWRCGERKICEGNFKQEKEKEEGGWDKDDAEGWKA